VGAQPYWKAKIFINITTKDNEYFTCHRRAKLANQTKKRSTSIKLLFLMSGGDMQGANNKLIF
jgi:hypothetical protein